jgi:hypothetical protein
MGAAALTVALTAMEAASVIPNESAVLRDNFRVLMRLRVSSVPAAMMKSPKWTLAANNKTRRDKVRCV